MSATNPPPYPKVTYTTSTPEESTYGSPELLMLWQAISNCAIPLVHQLIQQNPKLLHEKGWNGLTALHKACLMGDWTINYLLVEAGADVNALNAFDETPLHYACMRGVVSVVHLLVQRGGNLNAVDKNSGGVAHHTAKTGSVFVLKYLEMQGVGFRALDKELKTPLHITCHRGHIEALKFLMKKERSDLKQADIMGDTPVHIAAREGHGHMVWLMLQITGCSVLHNTNREGFTPVDLGGRGDKIGHTELKPILEYHAKQKDKNHVPSGPMTSWYFLLLWPGTWYTGLVLLANFIFPSYQGMVILLGMMWLLWNMMMMYHRIPHISRWANPVFAGTFGAGIFHTTFLYLSHLITFTMSYSLFSGFCLLGLITLTYYYVKLLLKEPDNKEYASFTMMCLLFLMLFCYVYWKILITPTGRTTQSAQNPETKELMTIIDLCVPQRKMDDFCIVCEIVKPERTKHCKLCDECYLQMDHHCLFLLKCIAKNNHVIFLRFVSLVIFSMVIFLINVVLYCGIVYPKLSILEIISELFWHNGWVLSMVVMNIVSILWAVNLLRFQFGLVATGRTTVFMSRTKSVLTPGERLMNIAYFLLGKRPYAVDPVLCTQGQTV